MGILRFIFFVILFYFAFRLIRYLFRVFAIANERNNKAKQQRYEDAGRQQRNENANPKYRNIEEAKYTEIDTNEHSADTKEQH